MSSPGSLKKLSLMIDKFLRHDFEYIIFDSLNDLLIYREKKSVKRFLLKTFKKIKSSKTKAIFYVLNLKEQEDLINYVVDLIN